MTDTARDDEARAALALAFAEHLAAEQRTFAAAHVDRLAIRLAHVAIRAGWVPSREPRVWLPGDTVPAGVVTRRDDDLQQAAVWPRATGTPLVEVAIPDYDAAVAAERARREAREAPGAAEPSAEATPPVSVREPREAVSGASGGQEPATAGDLSDTRSAQIAPVPREAPVWQCEAPGNCEAASAALRLQEGAAARLRLAADEVERRADYIPLFSSKTPDLLAAWLRAEADRPERDAWDDQVLRLAGELADEILAAVAR